MLIQIISNTFTNQKIIIYIYNSIIIYTKRNEIFLYLFKIHARDNDKFKIQTYNIRR